MKTIILDKIIETVKNPQLRNELKKDPRKYLQENCDLTFPPQATITVLENTPQKIYFVLPALKRFNQENMQSTQHEFVQKLKDPSFRESLKKNPRQVLDIRLPANCQIEVVEETDDHYYFVLPNQSQLDEISDEELESISAGLGKGAGALFSALPGLLISAGGMIGLWLGLRNK